MSGFPPALFAGRRFAVVGLGRNGLPAAHALLAMGAEVAAWDDRLPGRRSVNSYVAWMLVLEGLAIGVFAATDAFLFYVLFEATLIPIYFLIGSYGGPQRTYAAVKFLLYSLVGGLLMLAAVIGLFVLSSQAGEGTFLLSELQELSTSTTTQRLLFLGFFIAFAIS